MMSSAAITGNRHARRRMIVHLGVHKTGSTAIQRHLYRNSAALADRLVIRTPELNKPIHGLGRAAMRFSLNQSSDCEAVLKLAFADLLDDLPANDLPVLISHENIAGAPPGSAGTEQLYPAMPKIAALLKKWARDFDLSFVFYSRGMKSWRHSLWAQIVRSEGYVKTLAEFEDDISGLAGWGDLNKRMVRSVGASHVHRLRLEDEADRCHPGSQLLRHAGIGSQDISALPQYSGDAHERLRPAATEFIRQVNGLSLEPHARREVVELAAYAQNLFTAERSFEGAL